MAPMDEATWKAWEAVYEAALGEESWDIYEQMELEGLECIWSLELLDGSLWALVPNLPETQDIPREARRRHLHISLCKESDGVWPWRLDAIRDEWHGRMHTLRGRRRGGSLLRG